MSPQCFCRVWAIYSFVIFHDVRLSCNMSVFKKASFKRLFSLLITIVIFLYKIRFFGVPPAAASEEKEKLGPLHTVPQTAFPRPRQRTASSALLLFSHTVTLLNSCTLVGKIERAKG